MVGYLIDAVSAAQKIDDRVMANVPDLARWLNAAAKVAEALDNDPDFYKRFGETKFGRYTFSKISLFIALAATYYDRLAFYMTPDGIAYLKTVVAEPSNGPSDDEKVRLANHKWHENISPIPCNDWDVGAFFVWANNNYKNNIESGFAEYLLTRVQPPWLYEAVSGRHQQRMAGGADIRGAMLVRVRKGVQGHEKYSSQGVPRMWTFNVKALSVPKRFNDEWVPFGWSEEYAGLPTLRPVRSWGTTQRQVGCDFTEGTLYVMDGSKMYCYPPFKFHSALMSGEPISAGGILVAVEGRVVAIDNRSGHYRPGYRQLLKAVEYLDSEQLFEPDA